MSATNVSREKQFVFDYVDRNRDAVAVLGDSVFYFGELGMQEFETMGLMTGLLEDAGFTVERGICGFPTGFMASYGSGAPVIALHTEYDANPNNSQKSGTTKREDIVAGAPGHCEGHNCNAAVMVAGALAAKSAIDAFGLKGTIRVIGAPAEEQLISRPYYVRDGLFDDVDVAIHDHIASEFHTVYGLTHMAAVSAYFHFRGEAAHASTTPWKARDALDAVVLMDMGMAQFREHMEPTMRVHRVIKDGGDQPNVIPARAMVWWTFRAPTADGARALFEQGRKIAEGAAMMTNTELDVEVMSAVWPVRTNQGLAEVIQRNIEQVGMPEWTGEEDRLAREAQAAAGVKVEGLKKDITPLEGPAQQRTPSNDCGDVSWAVPMGRVSFPSNIPNVAWHHWCGGISLATSIAHKGSVAGAKVLAGSVLDLLTDAALVERAKETFAAEIGDVKYRSLLPPDQKPPVELNRLQMEEYRTAMRAHYIREKPVFA